MPLSADTLKTELQALIPTDSVAVAIERLATAFTNYFLEAQVGATSVASGTLAVPKAAMVTALAGINAPGAGAAVMQAGIIAFWGSVATTAAVIWAGNTPPVVGATVPPGLSGIAAALTPVFAANVAQKRSLVDSCEAIAAALHPLQITGLAAVSPPAGTVPIL